MTLGARSLSTEPAEIVREILIDLYAQIEDHVTPLARHHTGRLHCMRGCKQCCQDDLTVFEAEAINIRHYHADLLSKGSPHGPGACAFLDSEGACRIYNQRPYVCRTQGLPLRWLEQQDDGAVVEYRDICPLNETDQSLEELTDEQCWPIGPVEETLAELQQRLTPGKAERVPLRSLFG
ncbi:YkgJ family cysteine cluster protein [Planctomycetota bacterium]